MEIRLPITAMWLINVFLLFHVTIAQDAQSAQIVLMPSEIRQNLGQSVYVSCDPKVPNTDLISNVEWRDPKQEIIQSGQDLPIATLADQGGAHILGLIITSLKKQDVGNYTCSANYAGNQRLEQTIQILSQESIDFKDTETLQTPVLGSDAKIRCVVSADPAPSIDWTKDAVPLSKSDKRYIQQNDGILIKNIQESDEGVYRCRARVALLGEIKFKDIQVEVHVAPKISGAPKDVEGKETYSVAFQCVATGKPAPKYTWVNKDSEVLNGKEGYYVDDITGELNILNLRPEHTGTYRCTAYNAAGEVFTEANLRVLMQPKIEEFFNITRSAGSNSELRCIISGDPLPEALFIKKTGNVTFRTGIYTDERIRVVEETDYEGRRVGILQLNELSRSDDGLYACKGNSSGGSNEAWGHITVEFAPTFEDQPYDEFFSWEQKTVNISCLATSIPNATIQWFQREDVPIRETDQNLKIVSHGPNGILSVTPLDGSYFDTYTCKATNTLGTATHEVVLRQVQKPGPVSSTQVEKKTATTVSWKIRDPLDDGGRPILGYTTQFRLEDDPWDKTPQFEYWTKGSDRSYVVDDLTPQARYVFRFAARNDVGDGEWSGDKSVEMNKRSAPEEPLIYSINYPEVKKIPYTDHYELQWQVPLNNGEDIDFFQITYYTVEKKAEDEWVRLGTQEVIKVDYPGKSSYRLQRLKSDSFYKIELRAHNKIGFSTPSEAIIKTAYASAQPATPAPSHSNAGAIVGIVIAVLLLLLIILDIVCFFLKDAGVTATLIRKFGAKTGDKDKEIMIEEGLKEKESDKEAILKEEQEQHKQGEDSPAAEEIKKSESKGSMKDSSV